jgi:hypothetical protein
VILEWKKDGETERLRRRLFASDIEAIFKQISDNTCYRMHLDPRQYAPRTCCLAGSARA